MQSQVGQEYGDSTIVVFTQDPRAVCETVQVHGQQNGQTQTPDGYSYDPRFARRVFATENPLRIPTVQRDQPFGQFLLRALQQRSGLPRRIYNKN